MLNNSHKMITLTFINNQQDEALKSAPPLDARDQKLKTHLLSHSQPRRI